MRYLPALHMLAPCLVFLITGSVNNLDYSVATADASQLKGVALVTVCFWSWQDHAG